MNRFHRRAFLRNSAFAGIGFWTIASNTPAESRSPNEKLNIGIIGAGGRGAANASGVATENIVALCDTNDQNLGKAAERFPKASRYQDWRKLLEQKNVDAVVISTPDHHHALAGVAAMKLGKHVYCEKPLAHSVHEARRMRETYLEKKVATQMGTQIHAENNYRRVVELIQSGAIGPVREVHVWCTRVGFAPGTTRPKDTPPCPPHLHWDLWLGPAPERPYHPSYLGGCTVWEQWWDFGNGCLGDMGSHLIDLPFWALKLRQPLSAEAEGSHHSDECYPQWLIARWEHPATDDHPALRLTWYDGGKKPPSPSGFDLKGWGIGVLFVGDKGQLVADYGRLHLLPAEKFKDFQPPPQTIPPSLGHYKEWLHGCKTGAPTLCNFDYSGTLIEHNLLGTVAFRVGKKIQWDASAMKAVGCPEADRFIRREYRKGWEI
ncbi:MAG: Gfo/Idh/MocA family oxidoreductase [Thermoguttaceae bacterium]|jgi:predicted dehydrogenase|nr:Gfo/Idh/MocA family oxidoreductase [Thermoguttaceae bacterium]